MIHIANQHILLKHFLCCQFWTGEGSQDVSKHFSAGCPSAQATRPFKVLVTDLAKVSHHPAVDITLSSNLHISGVPTLRWAPFQVWFEQSRLIFDLHNTSLNIAKGACSFWVQSWVWRCRKRATTIRKKASDFFTIGGSYTRTPPRERCVGNPKNRMFAVNLRHLRLIFIDLYGHSNWNSRKESAQAHPISPCMLWPPRVWDWILYIQHVNFPCWSWMHMCILMFEICHFPSSASCVKSCRSEDLPTQLPRLRVAIFNAFPSRVLPHPGARCYLEWS